MFKKFKVSVHPIIFTLRNINPNDDSILSASNSELSTIESGRSLVPRYSFAVL